MKVLLKAGLALLPVLFLGLAPAAPAQISFGISIHTAPPVLPVYTQPPCPDAGYLWEPGYWSWGPDGYYWVPGVWVEPPQPGLLWTPGYWGFQDGAYVWNDGYWGPEVGFYGGVNYGFGYPGQGFYGGMWQGNRFRYNVAAWHVGNGFHDTYRTPVAYHSPYHSRASFNGQGGIQARPTANEERAMHAHHYQMTQAQQQHRQRAAQDRQNSYKENHGHPQNAAETRIGAHAANRPGARPAAARPANRPGEAKPGETHGRPGANAPHRAEPGKTAPARTERGRTAPAKRPATARPQSRPMPTARPHTAPKPKPAVKTNRSRPQAEHAARPKSTPHAEAHAQTKARVAARPAERAPKPEAARARTHAAPQRARKPQAPRRPAAHPAPHSHPKDQKPQG